MDSRQAPKVILKVQAWVSDCPPQSQTEACLAGPAHLENEARLREWLGEGAWRGRFPQELRSDLFHVSWGRRSPHPSEHRLIFPEAKGR